MSDSGPNTILYVSAYYKTNTEGKRQLAVAAALELIAKKITSNSGASIDFELDNLSSYADKIQAAIDSKG